MVRIQPLIVCLLGQCHCFWISSSVDSPLMVLGSCPLSSFLSTGKRSISFDWLCREKRGASRNVSSNPIGSDWIMYLSVNQPPWPGLIFSVCWSQSGPSPEKRKRPSPGVSSGAKTIRTTQPKGDWVHSLGGNQADDGKTANSTYCGLLEW